MQPLDGAALDMRLEERLRLMLAPRPCAASFDLPLAIFRAMIAEAPGRPDMARRLSDEVPRANQALLCAELDRAVASDEVVTADAAALPKDMIRHNLIDVLIDPETLLDDKEIQTRFELALQVFLRGVSRNATGAV